MIHQVFTRKHLLSLQPDALKFLLGILEEHAIAQEDVVSSLDIIAQEYLNQDGRPSILLLQSAIAIDTSLRLLNDCYKAASGQGV